MNINRKASTMLQQGQPELYDRLTKIAQEQDVSISFLVAEAVQKFIGDDQIAKIKALLDIDKRIETAKRKMLDEYNGTLRALGQEIVSEVPESFNFWASHFE